SNANLRKVKEIATTLVPICRDITRNISIVGKSREAFDRFNAEMAKQKEKGEALVNFWNGEFSNVAAAHYARQHVRQAVVRAKDSLAGKDIAKREQLEKEYEKLRNQRDAILSDIVRDPELATVEAAETLLVVAKQLLAKKRELTEAEDALKKKEQEVQALLREFGISP